MKSFKKILEQKEVFFVKNFIRLLAIIVVLLAFQTDRTLAQNPAITDTNAWVKAKAGEGLEKYLENQINFNMPLDNRFRIYSRSELQYVQGGSPYRCYEISNYVAAHDSTPAVIEIRALNEWMVPVRTKDTCKVVMTMSLLNNELVRSKLSKNLALDFQYFEDTHKMVRMNLGFLQVQNTDYIIYSYTYRPERWYAFPSYSTREKLKLHERFPDEFAIEKLGKLIKLK